MPSGRTTAPGEILVKVKPPYGARALSAINKSFRAQSLTTHSYNGIHQIVLPAGTDVERAAQEYAALPYVEFAEPNRIRRALYSPTDPYFSLQWALPKIGAPDFWDKVPVTPVVVAVIDTGVDYNHEDLSNKVIKGYDFINNDNDPMDDHFHGTHVAGIIAAETNNAVGIAGVAPGAKILAIKVLGRDGEGTDLQISKGIVYAADNGAKIINLSLGGPGWSFVLDDAVQYARKKGCLVVASAGNAGTSETYYPASYDGVVSVGATDSYDKRAYFSNFGPDVDIAAPGVDILSTYNKGGTPTYVYAGGTSMAAPVICGAAALISAGNPTYTADQLQRALLLATQDLGTPGRDDYFGYGLVDLRKAAVQKRITAEDTAPEIAASGSWQSIASASASGGTLKSASAAGSSLTMRFSGASICWFARTGDSGGIAKVYIDGAFVKEVDLYNPTTNYQQPVFYKESLSAGNHTIRIEVTGDKNTKSRGRDVNVDGFDIGNGNVAAGPMPPTGVVVNIKPRSVEITWNKPATGKVAGYNIYCSTTISGKCVRINRATITKNTFTVMPLRRNAAYYYKVTSVDEAGNESAPANPISIKAARDIRK
ncbi:MAG: S8 family serine peptidase [Actinobacteria bacterium]|nr:S8 family serine peptidase [Actinomycetota bacterium]